jgi:cell division initiation protein
MAFTPVEIRHVKLERSLWGYSRRATDRLLEEIVISFEDVWRERADLEDKLERLESDIARYRDLETLLRKTLVSAERSAQDLKDQARREADVLLSEAHAEARLIKQRAFAEREHLRGEASRIRSLLRSALAMVDAPQGGDEAAEAA